jgi:hypothetical protein
VTQNIGPHGHDDQPEQLDDNHLDTDNELRREIDECVDEIIRRPWFSALKSLPGEAGLWVGTEEELIEELKVRILEEGDCGDALVDEDFPSSAREIIEPPQDVDWAMRKERLWIRDYREVEKELRRDFDAPGWGRKAPILLERGLAAHKPSHEGAQYILASKYRNPLAILVVDLTYHDPKFKNNQRIWSGSARQWSGRTRDLATRLSIQLNSEFGLGELEPREKELVEELKEAIKLESPEDFRRFCSRMRTCAYILRDVGVKVSWEKHVGQKIATDEKYTYTWWTIEAPHWKKTQLY